MALCVLYIVVVVQSIPRPSASDFDIYTSLPFDTDRSSANEGEIDQSPKINIFSSMIQSIDVSNIFSKLSNLGNIGGLIYLGFKIYKYVHIKLNRHSLSSVLVNSTNIEKIERLEKEYEELWGIVHGLYQKTNEKIDDIELKKVEFKTSITRDITKINQQISEYENIIQSSSNNQLQITKLHEKYDKIEKEFHNKESQIFNKIDKLSTDVQRLNTEVSSLLQDNSLIQSNKQENLLLIKENTNNMNKINTLLSTLQDDYIKIKSDFSKFQKTEVPAMFKEYETQTLSKLQKFGDNIKKIIGNSVVPQSTATSRTSTSKSSNNIGANDLKE